MHKHNKILDWAIDYLSTHLNYTIINHQLVIETPYSVVYQINTNSEIFYLKNTPEKLFLEAKNLDFFKQQNLKNIPTIIAYNNKLHCFIMTNCGDISLRSLFNGNIELQLLKTGIYNYTKIQRQLENKVVELIDLNTPDWRLNKLPALYNQLINQQDLLISDGLTQTEINKLQQLSPICSEFCHDLSCYQIPDTINHCDFHENNMLLNKHNGQINIIDWGETVITNPFLSLNGCLWNITYFNSINSDDKEYRNLQKYCIAAWLDLYTEEKLLKAFEVANNILGIYAALAYEHMYKATQNQNDSVEKKRRGAISGCLRTFMTNI